MGLGERTTRGQLPESLTGIGTGRARPYHPPKAPPRQILSPPADGISGTRGGAGRRGDPLLVHGAEEFLFLGLGNLSTMAMASWKRGGRRPMKQGQSRLIFTPLFIKEKSLQILAAKYTTKKMDGSISLHVSRGERNRRPTTPLRTRIEEMPRSTRKGRSFPN
jgi:hypothetical protein